MTKKVVIFGTDNSGKTTLGQTIARAIPGGVYIPPLGPATLLEQIAYMHGNLMRNDFIIMDRFPIIEEFVCGNVFRGVDNFEDVDVDTVNGYFNKVDLFIFCNPGLEAILNWGEREQKEGTKEKIINLYSGYSFYFKKLKDSGFNVIEYNWKLPGSFDRIMEEVLR